LRVAISTIALYFMAEWCLFRPNGQGVPKEFIV
jgi:hypothetical protein